jgi:hypothetical protein
MSTLKKGVIVLTLSGLVTAGCETKTGTGAVVGGAGGAVVGGLIGSKSHGRAGEGALIGAGVGALGGALVGHGMDKNDEKKKQQEQEQNKYRERDTTATASATPPPAPPPPTPANAPNAVSRADIMNWSRSGVKDEIIIDRIQRSGQTFTVTAADEQQLKQAGVSDAVITAMKNNR